MNAEKAFLKSKVGRRIFLLFVCCALIPIMILGAFSFTQVTGQLGQQGRRRLRQSTKALGMGILERLRYLNTEMTLAAYNLTRYGAASATTNTKGTRDFFRGRFRAVAWVGRDKAVIVLFGRLGRTPALSPKALARTHPEKTALLVDYETQEKPRIFMAVSAALKNRGSGVLLGELDPDYLFGIGTQDTLPPATELYVLDATGKVIASSRPIAVSFVDAFTKAAVQSAKSVSRQFAWQREGQTVLSSCRTVFLKSAFFSPNWTVVLNQSKADVLAPVGYFKKVFPLTVLVSFFLVVFLTLVQIRRNLIPLERLIEGSRLIGEGVFDVNVEISSGDEFEDLAGAFNEMSHRLERQFSTLKTVGDIGRAVLSSVNINTIVATILRRTPLLLSCDTVCVGVADADDKRLWEFYSETGPDGLHVERTTIGPQEARELDENRLWLYIEGGRSFPSYIGPVSPRQNLSFLVLPYFVGEQLSGAVTLGYRGSFAEEAKPGASPPPRIQKDIPEAMQLRDQIAVAFSNARLVQELEALNWGTLRALARTVDAKSAWTAGHSERVTQWALAIADAMRLGAKQSDILRRAGLLHDIGKIGVPAVILDKPAKLTDREYGVIKSHPRLGARILEPIRAYADVIPIVLQHHEQFGGGGYPDGLSGEQICLGARILAVADVFDALVSERPYRKGWEEEKALDLIRKNAGTQFDPAIVEVFLSAVIANKRATVVPMATGSSVPSALAGKMP